LNEDEDRHPERMEHFGITTVEAMSAGCVPIVIKKGGQPEVVRHMVEGFLWNNLKNLKKYTLKLISDNNLWKKMKHASVKRAQKFNIDNFKKEINRFINYCNRGS